MKVAISDGENMAIDAEKVLRTVKAILAAIPREASLEEVKASLACARRIVGPLIALPDLSTFDLGIEQIRHLLDLQEHSELRRQQSPIGYLVRRHYAKDTTIPACDEAVSDREGLEDRMEGKLSSGSRRTQGDVV